MTTRTARSIPEEMALGEIDSLHGIIAQLFSALKSIACTKDTTTRMAMRDHASEMYGKIMEEYKNGR